MAPDCLVPFVENRPGVEHRLHVAEDLFHLPEFLVLAGHPLGREGHIGAQHPFAIKSGFRRDLVCIDCHATFADLDISGISAITDQPFGVGLNPLLEGCDHGLSRGRIFSLLPGVAADDVTPPLHQNLFDSQGRRRLGIRSLGRDLVVPPGSGEDLFAHLFHPAHPGAQDIGNIAVRILQALDRIGAYHAPIRYDTEALDAETTLQSCHHRQQARDIGGVAGPQFTTDRAAIVIENRPDHHLFAVRPVVFAVPELAESLAALSLKVDRGCIEEDKVQAGKQVAVSGKQSFLDQVFRAAGAERCRSMLINQDLPEKCHGPICVMQGDFLGSGNRVVTPPLLTRPVGSRHEQAMQDREENRPLNIKCKLPVSKQVVDNRRQAEFQPESCKDRCRADFYGMGGDIDLAGENRQGLLREPGQRADKGLDTSLGLELIETTNGGDDTLADFATDLVVFDKLQILVRPDFLMRANMEASLVEDTPGISINSLCSQENVKVALALPVLHFLTTCIVKSISCKRNRAKTIPQVLKKSLTGHYWS